MGLKLRGVVRCGTCGKPRGIRHTCVTSATSRRRRTRSRVHSPVVWSCGQCGKERGINHTCRVSTDFKKRKRRKERRQRIADERKIRDRKRKQSAWPGSRSSSPNRSRGSAHEPGTCGDRECPKYGCVSYWRGWDDGYQLGYEAGYGEGYAEGFAAGSAAAS